MPDHWHFIEQKIVNGKHFGVAFVVRDGYQEVERNLGYEMGYDVAISTCDDRGHLSVARTPKSEQG